LRESAYAATPQILSTSGLGIKYAVTKDVPEGSAKRRPQRGDIVAIEYTGYLSDGTVRFVCVCV
jgi:FKBP-type peptidyl-prolyl cis-trans isomerase